jgi:ATP-dependent Clp protease ATP-binding subunit ClpA
VGLTLDPECQAAVDLAKRAVQQGSVLETGTLLAALYAAQSVRARHPELAASLSAPSPVRAETPAKVTLDEPLQSLFQRLVAGGAVVTALQMFDALVQSAAGRACLAAQANGQAAQAEPIPPPASWKTSPERERVIRDLSSFGRMLTAGQRFYKGVVELESPLRALVRSLTKMKRRNALIIGFSGTGKSALVYELARRLVEGHPSIPLRLRDLDIFELSPVFLRSGASMVGQYEERVKALLETLRANPRVVMFVDEAHALFQSGVYTHGPFTEANEAFKDALGKGEIACIGCTTQAEFRHYIEPDGALMRRFTVIRLEPPSRSATMRILQARLPRVEAYYAPLRIPQEMLQRAIDLTEEYLPSRFQPDKSIQLLDEACAFCVNQVSPAPQVTLRELWSALEDVIGHSLARPEALTEESVFRDLAAKIIGQDDVLRAVSRAFVAGLGSWQQRSTPRGIFFFCGPTGVGKTETAILLAKLLGGGQETMVRVDCNTLQGSGNDSGPAINRLLGVPPGYIGYARGQGGILSRVRDLPECVVLFDEIEKADPGVGKLLLQILGDGRVEDVDGNLLDFRRAFLIFTTNAGCVYERTSIGFQTPSAQAQNAPSVDLEALKTELRSLGYGQEFLGRIHQYFAFRALDSAVVTRILERQLASLRESAQPKGFRLEWASGVVAHLAARWQPQFGVRHLTTILRHRITEQLAIADAQGELKGVAEIRLEILPAERAAGLPEFSGYSARERNGSVLTVYIR